ncbi:DegT/DnrJ/EryC1/StrS family aminotransferase [Mucilaginibacter jinjuensis]|uniref:DegT/DnrJ/EryC1/StrS family aminotransferase n=1 Tax=Mucilaginibacter jinjuensis TaxID=1176721 RepID=A0ABY7T9S2_9SPHI|nr:DegT/DnrJ/EryC1/StrS family aminotransferase [Mucilaginibacter jinjuensis]WCT13156.1 DegT/DnrJ/EryC1/StrS family aminotransferase [Mucilaginibacter jinjuensis]
MLPLVKPFLPPKEVLMPQLEQILYSGYIAEGEAVYEFERNFANFVSNPHTVSLNSGTAALHIALLLAGVGSGDEVISTVLTAEPTNVAIKLVGAKVIWADVDINTGLLDPVSVRSKITAKTKAIMIVHYAGMVADLDEFKKLSEEFNIPVIEDAAHALGSKYNGQVVGSISPYTIFSFQAIKHLTTIDGGMLTLKTEEQQHNAKLLRWFGLDKMKPRLENDIKFPGYKYHMNNVNATVGLVQLKYIQDVIDKHIANGLYFDKELANTAGVELLHYYPKSEASYWLYTLKVENRDAFIKMLAANGISASELHLRNDRHSIFAESKTDLPAFEQFYKKMVHIPCGWWVSKEDREKITDLIKKGW